MSVGTAAAEVFILHSPIQPTSAQQVTFTATVSEAGTTSIEIWEERRILTLCDGVKCAIPDPSAPNPTRIQVCVASPCQHTTASPYSNEAYIGYRAIALPSGASEPPSGYIYFAAGSYPWPNDAIPVYIRGALAEKIDLVFIPDTDYGANSAGFVDHVTALIKESYFSTSPFAQEIRPRREMWNFYITYQQGDAQAFICQRTPPSNWSTMTPTVNSGMIVHNQVFTDCSGIGEDSLFSAEPIFPPADPNYQRSLVVPIHESGHSVFSLADEYSGGGLFTSAFPEHNVFSARAACRNNAGAHGWPLNNCRQIGNTGWYRSDDGSDQMEDTSTTSNTAGPSDRGRASWKYGQCSPNGNC